MVTKEFIDKNKGYKWIKVEDNVHPDSTNAGIEVPKKITEISKFSNSGVSVILEVREIKDETLFEAASDEKYEIQLEALGSKFFGVYTTNDNKTEIVHRDQLFIYLKELMSVEYSSMILRSYLDIDKVRWASWKK